MFIPIGIVGCNVLQVSENRFGPKCLGMEAWYDVFMRVSATSHGSILVIQEEVILIPIDNNPPTVIL